MLDITVRYLHFIAIFVMFSLLTAQHIFLKQEIEEKWLKKAVKLDMVYGISALLTLILGMSLWVGVGKPAEFYSSNWIFHAKITLFILVGILSFVPTLFLRKNKNNTGTTIVPKYITMIIRLELTLLCIIPLLAVLMATGTGLN